MPRCMPIPYRPGDIAAAIRTLAGIATRRAALVEAGRRRAQCFDVPVIAAQLAALRRPSSAAVVDVPYHALCCANRRGARTSWLTRLPRCR